MQRLTSFLHVIDSISEWSGKIISFLLLGLMGIILIEVVSRYVLNSPTVWSFEASLYLFATVTLLGGAFTLLHGGHVSVDIIYNKFSPRVRAVMNVITFFFFFIFVFVLMQKGGGLTWEAIRVMERTESAWGPVIWPARLVIPLGAFLLLLQGLAKFFRDLAVAMGKEGQK
jgi:TRAP-type mannitol/chloroaromatic compound transport system permease small subunit